MPDTTSESSRLWAAYRHESGIVINTLEQREARNALVMFYLPLTEKAAKYVSNKEGLRGYFANAELEVFASFGLMKSIPRFNPKMRNAKGDLVPFEVFVWKSLVGSIIDEVRDDSVHSRNALRVSKRVRKARLILEAEGSPDSARNMAKQLDVSLAQLHRMILIAADVTNKTLSLDAPLDEERSSMTVAEVIPDLRIPEMGALLEYRSDVNRLRSAIAKLSRQDARVVQLYDFEHVTLRAIGDRMGLTEGRISQIHTGALERLHWLLRDLD